jgi:hypothetical protein
VLESFGGGLWRNLCIERCYPRLGQPNISSDNVHRADNGYDWNYLVLYDRMSSWFLVPIFRRMHQPVLLERHVPDWLHLQHIDGRLDRCLC